MNGLDIGGLGLVTFVLIVAGYKVNNRIERLRKEINNIYVRRDVCHERIDSLREDIKEIKTDVKELLKKK